MSVGQRVHKEHGKRQEQRQRDTSLEPVHTHGYTRKERLYGWLSVGVHTRPSGLSYRYEYRIYMEWNGGRTTNPESPSYQMAEAIASAKIVPLIPRLPLQRVVKYPTHTLP